MSAAKEVDVEQQLRLAAATAAWPTTPALALGVLARIESVPTAAARGLTTSRAPGARRATLRPVAALAFALLALLVVAGVAGALGFRLPGLDIVIVETLPSGTGATPAAGSGLDLGSPVPMAEAQGLDRPRVLVPAALPAPDTAYVIGAGDRRIVTLAWRAEPGQARIPASDLGLTIMAVPGETDDALIKKLVTPGTSIDAVTVGGDRGWWISGAPHELFIQRPDGDVGTIRSSIAGDTLVFARDGTLYRLESSLGRDATLAIAESLR